MDTLDIRNILFVKMHAFDAPECIRLVSNNQGILDALQIQVYDVTKMGRPEWLVCVPVLFDASGVFTIGYKSVQLAFTKLSSSLSLQPPLQYVHAGLTETNYGKHDATADIAPFTQLPTSTAPLSTTEPLAHSTGIHLPPSRKVISLIPPADEIDDKNACKPINTRNEPNSNKMDQHVQSMIQRRGYRQCAPNEQGMPK